MQIINYNISFLLYFGSNKINTAIFLVRISKKFKKFYPKLVLCRLRVFITYMYSLYVE